MLVSVGDGNVFVAKYDAIALYDFNFVSVDEEYCNTCNEETDHKIHMYDTWEGNYSAVCSKCNTLNKFRM